MSEISCICLDHLPTPGNPSGFVKYRYETKFPESCADLSYFHPEHSIIRQASGGAGLLPPTAYTYPDGRDDGAPVPVAEKHGVDIVDIQKSLDNLESMILTEKARREQLDAYLRESEAIQKQKTQDNTSVASPPVDSAVK